MQRNRLRFSSPHTRVWWKWYGGARCGERRIDERARAPSRHSTPSLQLMPPLLFDKAHVIGNKMEEIKGDVINEFWDLMKQVSPRYDNPETLLRYFGKKGILQR